MVYPCTSFVYMGIFSELTGGGGVVGSNELFLGGYNYQDFKCTEWKIVKSKVSILIF